MTLVQSLEHCRALPGTPPCLRGLACHLFCGLHLIGAPACPFGHPVGLGVGPFHGANREPARGGNQTFEGSASTRELGPCAVQIPDGHGQLLGRNPFLQLADPEHRVEAEAIGLHEAPPSSGTRPSSASVVAGSELISPTG